MLETIIPATSVLFQFYPAQVQAIEKAFAEAPAEASRMLADKYSEISISAVLAALLEMGLEMVEIVAVTAGIGALLGGAIGFSAGGAGAVPGAAVGLELGVQAGIYIAGAYGLVVMAKDFVKASASAATHLGLGVQAAWNAGESDQHSPIYDININAARTHIASALVILIDELIVAIILVLLHKKPGLEKLRATENGEKLERWAAENQAKLNKWYRNKIKSLGRTGDDVVLSEPINKLIEKVEGTSGKEIRTPIAESNEAERTLKVEAGEPTKVSDLERKLPLQAKTIDEAKIRLEIAKKEIEDAKANDKPLPTSPYALADKQEIVNKGLDENIIVRVIKTDHATDDGYISKVKDGKATYWTAPFSQVEHGDTDAEQLLKAFGTEYDPTKKYTMLIMDREKMAELGDSTSTIPTFENLNKMIVDHPDIGIDPKVAQQVLNADFAPKYEGFPAEADRAGINLSNVKEAQKNIADKLGYSPEDSELLANRHEIADKISAWDIFQGNGMTRDTNFKEAADGPVEVFTFDRKPLQLGELESKGALERVELN